MEWGDGVEEGRGKRREERRIDRGGEREWEVLRGRDSGEVEGGRRG